MNRSRLNAAVVIRSMSALSLLLIKDAYGGFKKLLIAGMKVIWMPVGQSLIISK